MVNIPYHVKRINVTTEAVPGDLENKGYEAIDAYATLKGGSNRVAMAIRNTTRQKLTLKKGTTIATVSVANIVPPMLAPNPSTYSDVPEYDPKDATKHPILEYTRMYSCIAKLTPDCSKPELTDERSDKLFSKLNLTTIESWSEADQHKAVDLLKEYHHLFMLDDLEMRCTSQVKHKIKVTDPVPFKQRY